LKKLLLLSFIAVMLFLVSVGFLEQPANAERPKGDAYSSSYSWEILMDSTADSTFDTTANAFKFTGLDDYSNVSGYIYFEVTAVDTGTSSTEIIDTTKDSCAVLVYTSWGTPGSTYDRLIYKISNIKPSTSATTPVYFNIPTDSIFGDMFYFKFNTAIGDSDHSVSRTSAGVTYKATVEMRARP
jgi:hypothetical protein